MKQADWANKLNAHIHDNLTTPFEWGSFDCCLFVADAVYKMTGTDFAAAFRGKYSTVIGAKRALTKYGQGDIKTTLNAFFGEIKPRLTAGRGDIALVDTPLGDALGIVWGGQIWVCGEQGLHALPMRLCLGCWEVSCHQ